jgi:hypothetical protein
LKSPKQRTQQHHSADQCKNSEMSPSLHLNVKTKRIQMKHSCS